jgi:hypothetical protein
MTPLLLLLDSIPTWYPFTASLFSNNLPRMLDHSAPATGPWTTGIAQHDFLQLRVDRVTTCHRRYTPRLAPRGFLSYIPSTVALKRIGPRITCSTLARSPVEGATRQRTNDRQTIGLNTTQYACYARLSGTPGHARAARQSSDSAMVYRTELSRPQSNGESIDADMLHGRTSRQNLAIFEST